MTDDNTDGPTGQDRSELQRGLDIVGDVARAFPANSVACMRLIAAIGLIAEGAGQDVAALRAEVERLSTALRKVSDIRDSIVGAQTFNFSEHAYPLVAVLDGAGFKGAGYEIARANLGTLIDNCKRAADERDALREQLATMTGNWKLERGDRQHFEAELATAEQNLVDAQRIRARLEAELAALTRRQDELERQR